MRLQHVQAVYHRRRSTAKRRFFSSGYHNTLSSKTLAGFVTILLLVVAVAPPPLSSTLFVSAAGRGHRRGTQHNRTSKNNDPSDYYNILGLKRNCKPKEIKVRALVNNPSFVSFGFTSCRLSSSCQK